MRRRREIERLRQSPQHRKLAQDSFRFRRWIYWLRTIGRLEIGQAAIHRRGLRLVPLSSRPTCGCLLSIPGHDLLKPLAARRQFFVGHRIQRRFGAAVHVVHVGALFVDVDQTGDVFVLS